VHALTYSRDKWDDSAIARIAPFCFCKKYCCCAYHLSFSLSFRPSTLLLSPHSWQRIDIRATSNHSVPPEGQRELWDHVTQIYPPSSLGTPPSDAKYFYFLATDLNTTLENVPPHVQPYLVPSPPLSYFSLAIPSITPAYSFSTRAFFFLIYKIPSFSKRPRDHAPYQRRNRARGRRYFFTGKFPGIVWPATNFVCQSSANDFWYSGYQKEKPRVSFLGN
jgi:hypothetical protein